MRAFRLAQADDIKRLKEIWKICFADEDQYIDFFYTNRFKEGNTAVLLEDGTIAAMLTMFPIVLKHPGEKAVNAAMIYGVATHPDYQKRGFSGELLKFSSRILLDRGVMVSVLVPAGENLFQFYRKQGYRDAFDIREAVFKKEEIASTVVQNCCIYPISAEEYNKRRNRLCETMPHISYADEDVEFQKNISISSGLNIYGIDGQNLHGCFAAEKISPDRVMIKELLCPHDLAAFALEQISRQIEAEEYRIRTAADFGRSWRGEIRPFGMMKWNNSAEGRFYGEKRGYLGLAFD